MLVRFYGGFVVLCLGLKAKRGFVGFQKAYLGNEEGLEKSEMK